LRLTYGKISCFPLKPSTSCGLCKRLTLLRTLSRTLLLWACLSLKSLTWGRTALSVSLYLLNYLSWRRSTSLETDSRSLESSSNHLQLKYFRALTLATIK
jgi:hypothetical protein